MKRKIVIYGGAFNPPHLGHAVAIDTVMRTFIVCPKKTPSISSGMNLVTNNKNPAIGGVKLDTTGVSPWSFICDEIWIMPSSDRRDKKIGVSGERRIDMIKIMLAELFPNPKALIKISTLELDRPILTTTYDTKLELDKKYPDCEFYFLVGADIFKDIETKWVKGKELFKIAKFIPIKKVGDISSTFVRKLISKGHSGVPYIIPAVARYIKENGFYR